jgi:hypothetical protein
MKLPSWRQVILTLVVIFIVYAIINDPHGSAGVTANLRRHLQDAATSFATFFDDLLND